MLVFAGPAAVGWPSAPTPKGFKGPRTTPFALPPLVPQEEQGGAQREEWQEGGQVPAGGSSLPGKGEIQEKARESLAVKNSLIYNDSPRSTQHL